MNLQRFSLLLAACACLVAAQSKPAVTTPAPAATTPAPAATAPPPAVTTPAPAVTTPAPAAVTTHPPPGVEEALRERVRSFYQAYVDGKFRKAYDIVADDSKDAFLTATKPHYDGFEIHKVVFANDYTTAEITTEIHTTFFFFERGAPEKTTEESSWKTVDGQWYWVVPAPKDAYTPGQRAIMNMLHVSPGGAPAPAAGAGAPGVPRVPSMVTPVMPPGLPPGLSQGKLPGGAAGGAAGLLERLRSQVRLDKDSVELRADKPGNAVVMVKNSMQGPVQIAVSAAPTRGLTVTSDKTDLAAGASATITITWTPVGPHTVPPPVSCSVAVRPTGVVLPFTVTFK